ncbi:MAG: hypothetical protein U9P38_06780, partial [Campylobacterota bacterium]|nr:hypothetical protein [Campylobacterota bacterium]
MIKYLLIFLLPFSLYGAKILNYNVYDRTDRVDIMVTFDAPFKGIIKQSRKKSKIIIKLYDAEIESSKIKKLSTQFVKSLTITPMFEYTQIVVNVPSSISLVASKTSDAYGLRLRFINPKLEKKTPKKMENEEPKLLSSLPTKSDDTISQRYYIVITLLIIGIITLLILKKKIIKKSEKQEEPNPWLF